jgi:multidrug efflux pump subunit AcrA (membrane-fusion protein)
VTYTILHASSSGVVTSVRLEIGQVVAAGQPVIVIANVGEPEIVIDVPEAHLAAFRTASFRAWLASAPDDPFEVVLRELSAQAAEQTRTYRARLKPAIPRTLPLGATRDAGRRARLVGPARGRDPGFRHHAERGRAGIVGRASQWR